MLPTREKRCNTPAPKAVARIAMSLVRSRVPKSAVPQIRLRPSKAKAYADLSTPLGLELYRYGYCEKVADVVRSLARPGSVVVDGGANVGLVTLIAAEAVGSAGRVIACEPSARTAELLRRNVEANGFDWVDVRQVALAEEPGRLTFLEFEPGSGVSSFAPENAEGATSSEVQVTTLDELASDMSLVKLDLEGSEVRALRGATRLLSSVRPDVFLEVEVGHLQRQGTTIGDLEALVAQFDYEAYSVDSEAAIPLTDWSERSRDLLLRPLERHMDRMVLGAT